MANTNQITDVVAILGNGKKEELSTDQRNMIHKLHDDVEELRRLYNDKKTQITPEFKEDDTDIFCDYETCRRYLVARQWNSKAALKQLSSTLKWRMNEMSPKKLLTMQFWQSPKAFQNPLAFNLRCIGIDKMGRPVTYTCYAEAHDRFDIDATTLHTLLLLESLMKLIKKRCLKGLNPTADSRQWVMIVDFDGLSLRDNNPKLGLKIVRLLTDHYPEMLNSMLFLNAPFIFSATWKVAKAVLDENTTSKFAFLKGDEMIHDIMGERLGGDIANWVINELRDNVEKRQNVAKNGYKKYWIAPEKKSDHDPRGVNSYVESEYYIQTPGDVHEKNNAL